MVEEVLDDAIARSPVDRGELEDVPAGGRYRDPVAGYGLRPEAGWALRTGFQSGPLQARLNRGRARLDVSVWRGDALQQMERRVRRRAEGQAGVWWSPGPTRNGLGRRGQLFLAGWREPAYQDGHQRGWYLVVDANGGPLTYAFEAWLPDEDFELVLRQVESMLNSIQFETPRWERLP